MQIKKEVKIEIPAVPNFIRVSVGGEVERGREMVNIEEFSKEELEEIGKQWTYNLIAQANQRRQ